MGVQTTPCVGQLPLGANFREHGALAHFPPAAATAERSEDVRGGSVTPFKIQVTPPSDTPQNRKFCKFPYFSGTSQNLGACKLNFLIILAPRKKKALQYQKHSMVGGGFNSTQHTIIIGI
jgi:hypothetical protein